METALLVLFFLLAFTAFRLRQRLQRIAVALVGSLLLTALTESLLAGLAATVAQVPLALLLALLALVIVAYLWGRKVLDDVQIF